MVSVARTRFFGRMRNERRRPMLRALLRWFRKPKFCVVGQNLMTNEEVFIPVRKRMRAMHMTAELNEDSMIFGRGWYYHYLPASWVRSANGHF